MIQVREKTVNSRDVISFSKEYADEEHEVFAPQEQGVQVLLDLLNVVNETHDDGLVLVRKSQLGKVNNVETLTNGGELRKQVLADVTETLFDIQTKTDVLDVLELDDD